MSNDSTQSASLFITEAKVITDGVVSVFNYNLNEAIKDGFVPSGQLVVENGRPTLLMVKYDQRMKDLADAAMAMLAEQMGRQW